MHACRSTLEDPTFLISEAVRGEGGVLRNSAGERFMTGEHPDAELAPRDIVARAIWAEMAREPSDCVYLDLRDLDPDRVRSRFPQIYATCLRYGIDITSDLIPVAPAAHYMMGGPRTDLSGATSVAGLYACGEAACSGVHGANRLASNSLLESVVFSRRAARAAVRYVEAGVAVGAGATGERAWSYPAARVDHELALPEMAPSRTPVSVEALPDLMWRSAGLVRDREGLLAALARLGDGAASTQHRAARLICEAALLREESRGAHHRDDHPEPEDAWAGHILIQKDRGRWFERA